MTADILDRAERMENIFYEKMEIRSIVSDSSSAFGRMRKSGGTRDSAGTGTAGLLCGRRRK